MDNSNLSPQTPGPNAPMRGDIINQPNMPSVSNEPPVQQNENTNQSNVPSTSNESPVQKPKKKHGFLKFLVVLALIIGVIKLISWGIDKRDEAIYEKYAERVFLMGGLQARDLTEEELAIDENNDGLTNGEKIKLGLNIYKSDTDGDGLSDYDEINKYSTDPTLFSTVGDIYGDGYKVTHGLELTKNYGNSKELETKNDKVKLLADDARDMEAYYQDYEGNIPDGHVLGMEPFRVYSFTGKVTVQIDNASNYDVISYDNIDKVAKSIDSMANGDELEFEIEDSNPILVSLKKGALSNANMLNSTFSASNAVDTDFVVISMPLLNWLRFVPVFVLRVGDNSSDMTSFEQELNSQTEDVFDISVRKVSSVAADFLDWLFGGYSSTISNLAEDENTGNMLFGYVRVHDSEELKKYLFGDGSKKEKVTSDDKKEKVEEAPAEKECEHCADTGFSVSKDAFKFRNPMTNVSAGGVCAGMAHIVNNTFNNGELPRVGEKPGLYGSYDVSDSVFDNTIFNHNLYGYSPSSDLSSYVNDEFHEDLPKLDVVEMSGPDAELVSMINHYYLRANMKIHIPQLRTASKSQHSTSRDMDIDEKIVEQVISELKAGRIVGAGLVNSNGNGHAVNVYAAEEDEDNGIIRLKVYDNNFPNDEVYDQKRVLRKLQPEIILAKQIHWDFIGNEKVEYSMRYHPAPDIDNNYRFTNQGYFRDTVLFYDKDEHIFR